MNQNNCLNVCFEREKANASINSFTRVELTCKMTIQVIYKALNIEIRMGDDSHQYMFVWWELRAKDQNLFEPNV
jgi:hypothetical protein